MKTHTSGAKEIGCKHERQIGWSHLVHLSVLWGVHIGEMVYNDGQKDAFRVYETHRQTYIQQKVTEN